MDDKIQIQKVLRALKVNKFNALYAKNRDEARKIMLDLIPLAAMVGVGDSGTIRQIGIIPALEERGTVVVSSGAMDMGQGLKTVLAQIVAEELGVYVDISP